MHILITDDLYTNRLQLGIIIRSMGYTCEEAAHGEEAIEKLRNQDFDLILMDIEMPVRNGLETTRFIRTHFKGKKRVVPVVAITAHELEEYADNYKKYGFNGFIGKPVTIEKLRWFLDYKKT